MRVLGRVSGGGGSAGGGGGGGGGVCVCVCWGRGVVDESVYV